MMLYGVTRENELILTNQTKHCFQLQIFLKIILFNPGTNVFIVRKTINQWELTEWSMLPGSHCWGQTALAGMPGTPLLTWINFNTLRPRQNGLHFPEDISIKISLKFVPKGPINNIQALIQMMAWHWIGNKPLSEPMMG